MMKYNPQIAPHLKVRRILVGVLLVPLVFYIYFQFHRYLRGPVIEVTSSLEDTHTFTEPLLIIEGRARNIDFAWINGNQMFTNQEGFFTEELLLQPGYNLITLRGIDRFGREVEEVYEVALDTPSLTSKDIQAFLTSSSTPRLSDFESGSSASSTEENLGETAEEDQELEDVEEE